jgi:hypothetical protein
VTTGSPALVDLTGSQGRVIAVKISSSISVNTVIHATAPMERIDAEHLPSA